MKREMVCIACPIGCRLTAEWDGEGKEVRITGNKCRRGEEYGREEILSPSRVVTATVPVKDRIGIRVPVKTSHPLPKHLIRPLLEELYEFEIPLPVARGKLVFADYQGSGVDVVTTRTMSEGESS